MDRCDGCGFVYDLGLATDAGADIVRGVEELAALLRRGGIDLATRVELDQWSPLEYGCHLRDVLLVQRERVLEARRTDRPAFTPMGRDERVDHDGYADQVADDVARQLVDAGMLLANVLARLGPDGWERTVVYNFPARTERSMRWVAVHTVHEVRHHLQDVRSQLA